MSKIKSTTGKSSSTIKAEQTSSHPKDIISCRPTNGRMIEKILLIWLDKKIDINDRDCRYTIKQLQRVMDTIDVFTDNEECIEFLESIHNQKVCMIISGSLGQMIMPRIHDIPQMDSIFIFCGNEKLYEQWAKEWSKIRGVFTDILPICETLKYTVVECERNTISISFMTTNGDISKKNLDQLDPSFMYTQILKEILLSIEFDDKHIQEFIQHCREVLTDNDVELKYLHEFERKYSDKTSILWYTRECFLYKILNRSLRLMDVDVIIKTGFLISDLHHQIEQLYAEQSKSHYFNKSFRVYRGQGMSKTEFEQMTKTKGGLISFNSFLSTSTIRDISLEFMHQTVKNSELIGILFVMEIDPSQSTTPFAFIKDVSYYKDSPENEILFSMHTVFRIDDIKPMGAKYQYFQVDLRLTNENDKDLRQLTDYIREETFPDSNGWHRLGQLLLRMDEFEKANQVYEILLKQTNDKSEKASIYNQLGLAKFKQGDYQAAIKYYKKDLEISVKTHSFDDLDLAKSYNNIGMAYNEMGKYSEALTYYEKDLAISQKILSPNDPDLAASYNNIGEAYRQMGEYSKALSSYEKALQIKKKSLPTNHPDLGSSYNNIGLVYEALGDYSKARSFYSTAVENGQQSLPSNNPTLKERQQNLDRVKKRNYDSKK